MGDGALIQDATSSPSQGANAESVVAVPMTNRSADDQIDQDECQCRARTDDARLLETAGPPARRCAFRKRPVCDALQAAIASGVPVATTSPPAWPPSGPKSIT